MREHITTGTNEIAPNEIAPNEIAPNEIAPNDKETIKDDNNDISDEHIYYKPTPDKAQCPDNGKLLSRITLKYTHKYQCTGINRKEQAAELRRPLETPKNLRRINPHI